MTGYYEPVSAGEPDAIRGVSFSGLRTPADLVNLVAESERGAMAHAFTHARQTADGLQPYFTRQEIEEGALRGRGLEFVYLADAVDCFFMHVQGSG